MKARRILVPVDFSLCSKNALKVAAQLAKLWDSKLYLLHAINVVEPLYAFEGPNNISEGVENTFTDFLIDIDELKNVRYEYKVIESGLIDAMYTYAKEESADLIVMGTKGSHDAFEKLLGSQTVEIIRTIDIPVLVIPENITKMRLEKIGIAIDAKSLDGLDLIHSFAELFDADIQIFFVGKNDEKIDFQTRGFKAKIDQHFKDLNCECFNVNKAKVEDGIIDFVKEHKLDLLVMIPRSHDLFDRAFHKSVTKNIAMKIRVPLLTLND